MSADRDRQREHLAQVMFETEPNAMGDWRDLPGKDYWLDRAGDLLDHGVTVELPPEPEVKPGTTGTATVRDEPDTTVRRAGGAFGWYTFGPVGGEYFHGDGVVTDFVPDPEPLTAEAVQDIQQAIETASFSSAELARFVGQRLLPYVAGGPR